MLFASEEDRRSMDSYVPAMCLRRTSEGNNHASSMNKGISNESDFRDLLQLCQYAPFALKLKLPLPDKNQMFAIKIGFITQPYQLQ